MLLGLLEVFVRVLRKLPQKQRSLGHPEKRWGHPKAKSNEALGPPRKPEPKRPLWDLEPAPGREGHGELIEMYGFCVAEAGAEATQAKHAASAAQREVMGAKDR